MLPFWKNILPFRRFEEGLELRMRVSEWMTPNRLIQLENTGILTIKVMLPASTIGTVKLYLSVVGGGGGVAVRLVLAAVPLAPSNVLLAVVDEIIWLGDVI